MTDKKDEGNSDRPVVLNLDTAVLQALASASQAEVAQADLHAEVMALAAAIPLLERVSGSRCETPGPAIVEVCIAAREGASILDLPRALRAKCPNAAGD